MLAIGLVILPIFLVAVLGAVVGFFAALTGHESAVRPLLARRVAALVRCFIHCGLCVDVPLVLFPWVCDGWRREGGSYGGLFEWSVSRRT